LLLLLTGLTLAAPGALAVAQPVVSVGARVVLASDGPPPAGTLIGPRPQNERVQTILPRLKQVFRYREYTWLDRYRAEVPMGTTQRWPVPGGRQLEVTPDGMADHAVRMRIRLAPGSAHQLPTTIQVASGQPAVLGGPPYANGVLIVIIWANANDDPEVRDESHRGPGPGLK
jgi:hypothetical protein